MKIFNLQTNQIFDIEFKYSGENRLPCPSCSDQRRKKKDPCFSFNQNEGIGFCHHCDSRYVEYKPHEEKEYKIPVWENYTDLDDNQVKWFSKRMISQNTLIKMKVSKKAEWMPQEQKEMNTIAFPYYRNGEVVNVKYRDGKKNFKLEQGAELIWYNFDALKEYKEIAICEGEIDLLSFIEEGIENVISVPNGASVGKMEYLDSTIDLFNDIEKVYIAVDVDEKGIKLRDELIRRIGAEKCFICNFSEFKDANEYLCHKGRESLLNVLKNAKQVEVEGVVNLPTKLPDIELLFKEGMQKGATIRQSEIDEHISWELGRLATFTAAPSAGKSEFVDYLVTRLNLIHNWKVCYWSPENYPMQYHYSKLTEKIVGKSFSTENISSNEFWNAYEYIKENFFWIDPEEPYLDTILEKFKFFIKTKGVKVVVLDPFANMSDEVDYKEQGKMLTKMSMFARKHNILFILVAHPRKLQKDAQGNLPLPTMYDISGTADFWNKSDYGISMGRNQDPETKAFQNSGVIAFLKIKYKHLGKQGTIDFVYNYKNGRYVTNGSSIDFWDNSNWLSGNQSEEVEVLGTTENAFDECPF